MPVSIPAILATQQLAIASCDTMNLDAGDISNTGKSTAAQTNSSSEAAQFAAINASSETFATLGDLTQFINPIVAELNNIVARVNAKLLPYEQKVARAEQEQNQIASSNSWYSNAIGTQETVQGNAQAVIDGLDPADPGYADDVAAQQSIIDIAQGVIDTYNDELSILNGDYATDWEEFRAYHQAVVDDIISTFNTIMSPVRAAFSQANAAIETSNTNILSGKNQMLDAAADIAKNIAKTAGKAVTSAIGDIAENSSIMKPVDEPVSYIFDPNDSFRGARDTQRFLGVEWDGVIPSHVEVKYTTDADTYDNTADYHVFQFGEKKTRGFNRHLLPIPVEGKIHSYPLEFDNNYILGLERFSYFTSPAIANASAFATNGVQLVYWYSDTPGGPARLDTEGKPLVGTAGDIEFTLRYYQVYSLKDVNYYDATGSGGKVPYSEYVEGDPYITPGIGEMVFPVVSRTYFINWALVTNQTALSIQSPRLGLEITKNNVARAPSVNELVVIDPALMQVAGFYPAVYIENNSNVARSIDESAGRNPDYELFEEYVERNRIVLEPSTTGTSGTDYNDKYTFLGSTYSGLDNPYGYDLPSELTPELIVDSVGRGKFDSPSFGTKMSIGLTVPPVTPGDTYSPDTFETEYGNMSWSSNTFVVDSEGAQLSAGTYALVVWVSDTPGGTSRGIGRNYIVTDPNTEYFNKITLINDTKYWEGKYDYFKTVSYDLTWVGNSAQGGTSMALDLINPTGFDAEVRFVNFALVKNDADTFTDYDSENPTQLGVYLAAAPGTAEFDNFVFTPDVATWQSESFSTVTSYVDSVATGDESKTEDEDAQQFKNLRVLRGSDIEGSFTNMRYSAQVGRYELVAEPENSPIGNFASEQFTIIRVLEEDLNEFFGFDAWTANRYDGWLKNRQVLDTKFNGTRNFFAPLWNSLGKNNYLKYYFRDRVTGDVYDPANNGGFIYNNERYETEEGSGVYYRRLIIFSEADQDLSETFEIGDQITRIPIYTPQNWYFGYVRAGDVEGVEYLPWKAAKANGKWGGFENFVTFTPGEEEVFTVSSVGIKVVDGYGYNYLKPQSLQYVWFGGEPAYRIIFERTDGDNSKVFNGTFNSATVLTVGQEKTAAEIARDEAQAKASGSVGQQPFIATDNVLTYDTSERATADFRAGIYSNERLIRINNFRRSEDLGLGELFVVAGTNWMPVNEWEEAWRERTGNSVDVEDFYGVTNNILGLRQPPFDTTSYQPAGIPEFAEPSKSKTEVVGDRTINLGPMNPTTDLISGADANERATKEHYDAISPFEKSVEDLRKDAVAKTAGLGGFDKFLIADAKVAKQVETDVKKLIQTAKDDAENNKFDFVAVTANMFSTAAKSTATIVKGLATSSTSLLSSARAAIKSACATAFPQLEALIGRSEPPILADPSPDITSGSRITGSY